MECDKVSIDNFALHSAFDPHKNGKNSLISILMGRKNIKLHNVIKKIIEKKLKGKKKMSMTLVYIGEDETSTHFNYY
jgi:hypothetical protein